MKPEERDLAYIWDMREASRDVKDFVEGASYVSFCADKKMLEIPWKRIIGLRNILAHEYGEILVERIWRVAVENVPGLFQILDAIIPAEPKK